MQVTIGFQRKGVHKKVQPQMSAKQPTFMYVAYQIARELIVAGLW